MNRQAYIEEAYYLSFNEELEKIALSPKTLASAARKAALRENRYNMDFARNAHTSFRNPLEQLQIARKGINSAAGYNKANIFKDIKTKERLRDVAKYRIGSMKSAKKEVKRMKEKAGYTWIE